MLLITHATAKVVLEAIDKDLRSHMICDSDGTISIEEHMDKFYAL